MLIKYMISVNADGHIAISTVCEQKEEDYFYVTESILPSLLHHRICYGK
jgi:hypothetical protein